METTPDLSGALTILSAIITPAVLILATGSLLLTTSQRLSRSMDRARKLADQLENLSKDSKGDEKSEEKKIIIFEQMRLAAKRAKILQRAMTDLYLTLGIFVSTSVVIGIFEALNLRILWVPIALGLSGTALLFYGSLILINESRIALSSVNKEIKDMLNLSLQYIPKDHLLKKKTKKRSTPPKKQ
jgi:hypothetical protein